MKGHGDSGSVLGPIVVATVAVVAASLMDGFEAIRVYEGTNFGRNSDPGRGNSTSPNQMTESLHGSESPSAAASRRAFANVQQPKFAKEIKPTSDLYKVKLTQKGYLQFLRYLADIPPVREFTFCMWFAGSDLSRVQPFFSYGVQGKERLLSFWYEPKDSTIRMSIRDDLAFKIPAIIREGKWYHVCLSWDGVHGRWILFLDGSKIGSGQLHKYKGTYIPGGGEVVIGRQTADTSQGTGDGIEGEIFGFNLVDESVKDETFGLGSRIVSDKPPEPVSTPYVPPFKALPPIKKSYQEIKAYVKSLPSDPGHIGRGTRKGPKNGQGYPVRKPTRKGKPQKVGPRPARTKSRQRYKPPIRKAVVYERADRQMRADDGVPVRKMGEPAAAVRPGAEGEGPEETYRANHGHVHGYRLPEGTERGKSQYEIYEIPDEDEEGGAKSDRRKSRQDFDLDTARKTNSLYASSNKRPSRGKTKFHFERKNGGSKLQRGVRRSLSLEEKQPTANGAEKRKAPLDFIPVNEIIDDDVSPSRRKRAADATAASGRNVDEVEDLAADFRRLPHIPDGFISLFANPSTADMERKLDRFFLNGTASGAPPPTIPSTAIPARDGEKLPPRNDELFDGILPRIPTEIRRTMVVRLADLERRPGITAGSELVRRSFEECGADRGSPLSDRDRLIISWANTPVRIYGGAVVAAAENICGHF